MELLEDLQDNDILIRIRPTETGDVMDSTIVGLSPITEIPMRTQVLFNAITYLAESAPLPLVWMMAEETVKSLSEPIEEEEIVSIDMSNVVMFNGGKSNSTDR